jgi:hypothetical protein
MSTLFGGGAKSISQTATRAMGIDLQGAQYGAAVPVVFGQNKVAGNVIDYMDFKAIAHQSQQQGGKGGGGGGGSTSYTYSASFILGLCEGVASIVKVYKGTSTVNLAASGGVSFSGATGQAAWSHLSGLHALGYSGTTLAAFQNLDLGSSASLPNFNFEVAGRNQLGGGVLDAAPSDIFNVICTDTQIGVQFNYLGDLTQFANYTKAAGLVFSPTYKTQSPAQQTLTDLLKYSNCTGYFSEGVLKIVPYADVTLTGNGVTFTPNVTAVADLGPNDFITNGPGDPVTIHRKSPTDSQNLVRVEFKDRSNTYHTGAVVASIDQDVIGTGVRADTSESVDMITGSTVARLVAQNLLQRIFYIRNTYEFQLSWRYCYLEPMDVLTLTDANTGLYLTPVRVTEVSEDEHGLLSIVAEEFPQGISHGNPYGTQANAGTTVDPNSDPGPIDGPYLFRGPGFLVSNNTPEIWCALTGNNALWAGCDIYMSHDGTTYSYLSTTTRSASYGYTTNALALGSDPDTTGAPNVLLNGPAKLLGGSQADADQFNTLAMIDTEIVSYQTATLAGGPSYTLGYLRRGGYGSAIASHAASAPFVRLDNNIVRIPVDPSQIGQTVYLKFVSFNVFGLGGRTLATETAYPYVIGTNIELPDVPLTPSNFAVLAVSDGVNLTWLNTNPAAVGSTSIEYATALAGPFTVLAQEGPTTTSFHHSFTNGATFYYRLRSRGPLISGGWSPYTAVLSSAGVNTAANIAAAQTTANNAQPAGIVNPGFEQGMYGWTPTGDASNWFAETGTDGPNAGTSKYMVHTNGSGPTSYLLNSFRAAVFPGQSIIASCKVRGIGSPTAHAGVRLLWLDKNFADLSSSTSSDVYGVINQTVVAVGTAPQNAAYVSIGPGVGYGSGGRYTFDDMAWNYSSAANTFEETNATRTSSASDNDQIVHCTYATGCVITIPTIANATWPPGATLYALQGAAGQVQFVGASGVTFAPSDSQMTRAIGSLIAVKMIADNVWEAVGDLAYTVPPTTITGNATNASAQPTNIAISADGQHLVRRSNVLVSEALTGANVANVPAGNIASATTQAALNELDTKKATVPGSETFAIGAGTADAITVAFTPALTALTDGMQIKVRAGYANATTAPTIKVDALTAYSITKNGNHALAAGDIYGAGHELLLRYVAATPRWELMNPASAAGGGGGGTWGSITGTLSSQSDLQAALNSKVNSGGTGTGTDAYVANVVGLYPMDTRKFMGYVNDVAGATITSLGGIVGDSTIKRFGKNSLSSNGQGICFSTPISPCYLMLTQDFTWEVDFQYRSLNIYQSIISNRPNNGATGGTICFGLDGTGSAYVFAESAYLVAPTAIGMTPNVWHNGSITCISGVGRFFIDGNQVGANFTMPNINYRPTLSGGQIAFGGDVDGTEHWVGSLANGRITLGTGRYAANYTPATDQWPFR